MDRVRELKMLDQTRSPRTSRSMAWSMVEGRWSACCGDCPRRAGEAQPPPLSLLATVPVSPPRWGGTASPSIHRVFLSLLLLFNTTRKPSAPPSMGTAIACHGRRGGFDLLNSDMTFIVKSGSSARKLKPCVAVCTVRVTPSNTKLLAWSPWLHAYMYQLT